MLRPTSLLAQHWFPLKLDGSKIQEWVHELRRRRFRHEFLHAVICVPPSRAEMRPEVCTNRQRRLAARDERWIDLALAEQYQNHSALECLEFPWKELEDKTAELRNTIGMGFVAAGCPDSARRFTGCILSYQTNGNSRRGRPALKRPFYALAADYVRAARWKCGSLPWGFFPALAFHVSTPWLGLTFTAHELEQAVYERRQSRVSASVPIRSAAR
jgi:hypothetical protein